MRLTLAAVISRRQGLRPGPTRDLFQMYVDRMAPYAPVDVVFADTENALTERLRRDTGRVPPVVVLLDSRGQALTSEKFADKLRDFCDAGTQQLVLAVGPANGWSDSARGNARWLLSFGPMTLPHELALVVLAEQVYRAHTILAGHPYHAGHEARE